MGNGRLRLREGENVIAEVRPSPWWSLGYYLFSLGLWTIWRRKHRYVLTSQRLIALRGVISKSERIIPIDRIQDLDVKTSPLSGGRITLSTAGGPLGFKTIGMLTQRNARSFADAIQLAAQSARRSGVPAAPPNWPAP